MGKDMLSDENKAARLDLITGSDAAIICGLSPFCTPYQLWLYKTKREVEPDISDKPAVKAGNMLEGAVRDWLAFVIKTPIHVSNKMYIHAECSWMAGNIDGFIAEDSIREEAIVEIKTTSSTEGWGDSGTSIIPRNYLLQVAHYMAVCNAQRCYVAVLIRGIDFRHYCIERDEQLEAILIQKEKEFWSCVQLDIPPGPVYNKDLVDYLNEKEGVVLNKADYKELERLLK